MLSALSNCTSLELPCVILSSDNEDIMILKGFVLYVVHYCFLNPFIGILVCLDFFIRN